MAIKFSRAMDRLIGSQDDRSTRDWRLIMSCTAMSYPLNSVGLVALREFPTRKFKEALHVNGGGDGGRVVCVCDVGRRWLRVVVRVGLGR